MVKEQALEQQHFASQMVGGGWGTMGERKDGHYTCKHRVRGQMSVQWGSTGPQKGGDHAVTVGERGGTC